jgi:hypothetical protein
MVWGWVCAPSGRFVGRLHDLVVRLGVPLPMVRGLVVTGSGRPPALVAWTDVASIGADGVLLAAEPTDGSPGFQLAGDELLLPLLVLMLGGTGPRRDGPLPCWPARAGGIRGDDRDGGLLRVRALVLQLLLGDE